MLATLLVVRAHADGNLAMSIHFDGIFMDKTEKTQVNVKRFEQLSAKEQELLIDRAAYLVANHYIDKGDRSLYEVAVKLYMGNAVDV